MGIILRTASFRGFSCEETNCKKVANEIIVVFIYQYRHHSFLIGDDDNTYIILSIIVAVFAALTSYVFFFFWVEHILDDGERERSRVPDGR